MMKRRPFSRKPRRRSRFSRTPSEPTPRFDVGDQAGQFNVLEYLGWSSIKPEGEAKKLCQEHHWYRVRCSCGNTEIHTQQQLIDTRRHRICEDCITQLREVV